MTIFHPPPHPHPFLLLLLLLLLFLLPHPSSPASLATTFTSPPPPHLHLRIVDRTYVLASGQPMTNATAPTLLASPTPTAGDTLLRVDGTPLTTLTLASILDQIGTTAVLPIIDSSPSSTTTTAGDTIDPGWKVRGFVRIETFMPKEMEFAPGFPARVQAFRLEQQHRLERQLAAREQAKVEAETLALRAAEAQTMLDTQKHELAMQENKRKTLEEGQKHELAKTAVEKAAVQNEIARKRQEQKDETNTKSIKEASEKAQIAAMVLLEKQQAEKDRIERSNSRKRAEEQKKRDKADKMKQIEEPGFEYFDVEFRTEGSLDLWFKPGIYLPTLEQTRANTPLIPNDVLVGINKEPLPVPGTMDIVMQRLQEASLPRTLRWKRALAADEQDVVSQFAPLQLWVKTPDIVAGMYALTSALFGGNDTCTGLVNISLGFPSKNGCKSGLKRTSVNDPKGSIVCVLRGTCNFVVKLRNVQQSGAKAMVVINTKKEPLAMPAGNFKVDDLHIHAAMAVQELGDIMTTIGIIAKKLRLGAGVMTAKFVGGNSSCLESEVGNDEGGGGVGGKGGGGESTGDGSGAVFTKWLATPDQVPLGVPITMGGSGSMKVAPDDGRGILYLWNGINTVAFEVMKASFGAVELPAEPFVLKLAKPLYGCKGTAGNTKRAIVVVERGDCPFIKKAQVAQAQGARVLLVINTDENLFSMPAPEKDGKAIKIPVAMLPFAAKNYLTKATLKGDILLIARLVFKATMKED